MRAIRRSGWLALLAVAALAGCSSDSAGNATIPTTATTSPPPTSATTTTITPTTTATTGTSTTTEVGTTPASTEPVPTDAKAAIEAAVRAAYAADEEAWKTCLTQMPSCDVDALAAVEAGPALENSQSLANSRNADGIHASNVDGYRYSVQSVLVHDGLRSAELMTCIEDAVVTYKLDATGGTVVVDDSIGSLLIQEVLELGEDGVWRVVSAASFRSATDGTRVCTI